MLRIPPSGRTAAGTSLPAGTLLCENQQAALDIVGESVYRDLLHLHSLRTQENLGAWMDRIVVHVALDHLRKLKPLEPRDEGAASMLPATEKNLSIQEKIDL